MTSPFNDKFIKVNLFKVASLKEGYVFAGKIKFNELNKICKFTLRDEPDENSYDNTVDVNKEFFQRHMSDQRLKKIKDFLEESFEADQSVSNMFPSSVILYNPISADNKENEQINNNIEVAGDSTECFFQNGQNDLATLFIPNNERITLIVDGQHRIYATKLLYDEYRRKSDQDMMSKIENLQFVVTYLLGRDVTWPAKIFIDVNFKQKPVNRSLYYDIFGSLPPSNDDDRDDNVLKLSHDLCEYLDEHDQSPIKGMIKMVGIGNGFFSQGFMVDAFRKVFSSRSGVWTMYAVDYKTGGHDYFILSDFMQAFLSAIKECYPSSWPNESLPYTAANYNYSILCKTTGMGAFIKLIVDIFPLVHAKKNMKGEIKEILSKISDSEARKIFGKDGEYAGAGAAGLQGKLYEFLKVKLELATPRPKELFD